MKNHIQLSSISLIGIALAVIGLALTVYAIAQSTEFRQHAAEGAVLYLRADPRMATAGEKVTVSLDVDTQDVPVTTARVNLTYPQNKLTFESTDFSGSPFDMFNTNLHGNGYIQIARDASSAVNGKNHLATITFVAKSSVNMDDIQPVTGTAIVNTENKNIYTNAVSREETQTEKTSLFSIQFFVQFFTNLLQSI